MVTKCVSKMETHFLLFFKIFDSIMIFNVVYTLFIFILLLTEKKEQH
jgi:hypothetical protein